MLKKVTFGEIDLRAYEFACAVCSRVNVIVLGNREKDIAGAICENGRGRVWFDSRSDPILGALSELPRNLPRDEYLRARAAIEKSFLKSLPAAEVCETGEFARLITNLPDRPVTCAECKQETEIGRWRDVSAL